MIRLLNFQVQQKQETFSPTRLRPVREDHKLDDTKECKDTDNKPELQHLHLLAFGTDLAIYFCVLPRLSVFQDHTSMLNLVVDNLAPYLNVSTISFTFFTSATYSVCSRRPYIHLQLLLAMT